MGRFGPASCPTRYVFSTAIAHRPHFLPRVGGLDYGTFHGFLVNRGACYPSRYFIASVRYRAFGGDPLPRSATPPFHDLVLP